MKNVVLILTKGPYHGVSTEWPLRFMEQAIKGGHKVTVILAEDAVFLAKKGQEQYIQNAVKAGAVIKACQTCTVRRGLNPETDFLPGIKIGNMVENVKLATNADTALVF